MNHLRNMYLYFLAATFTVFALGFGTSITGSWLLAGLAAAAIAGVSVVGGIYSTMQMRQRLNLMQTGRLLQYASFIAFAFFAVHVVGFVFAAAITVSSAFFTAIALVALAFGAATLFGEVPTRGRTWLPMRR